MELFYYIFILLLSFYGFTVNENKYFVYFFKLFAVLGGAIMFYNWLIGGLS